MAPLLRCGHPISRSCDRLPIMPRQAHAALKRHVKTHDAPARSDKLPRCNFPVREEENATAMLDVHAPHESVHGWKDFFVHIATIVIGLLIAIGLEQTVEFFHHRHQAQEGLELLRRETDENSKDLEFNARVLALTGPQHRADIGVVQRLRAGAPRPGDRLIFVRPYEELSSSAWKVVHESNAAVYIPRDLMEPYDEIYADQQFINDYARSADFELQKATAALNTEHDDQDSVGEDRVQSELSYQLPADAADFDAAMAKLSGVQDLSRLTPSQIDRLEQGFQQAVTDDRRLHRLYILLGGLYKKVAKEAH
jgi:hypothetical protein